MSKKQDDRVLSRQRARELNPEELNEVAGGNKIGFTTLFCTIFPSFDGDDD